LTGRFETRQRAFLASTPEETSDITWCPDAY
jgi:hypothetical protein